jgi:hypothetical protein
MRVQRSRARAWSWLLAAVLAASVAAAAQTPLPTQSPSPTPAPVTTLNGKWTMSLEIQMGTSTPSLEFVQQGEKITGTYEGRYGKFPLTGVLKNRVLDFVVTINAEGTDAMLSFRGEVSTDFKTIVKGVADLGGMGEGAWTAKRNEK